MEFTILNQEPAKIGCIDDYLASILPGKSEKTSAIINKEVRGLGHSFEDNYLGLFASTQVIIGGLWSGRKLTISEEHWLPCCGLRSGERVSCSRSEVCC